MALKSMSISNLQDLRDKVDAAIADKIYARSGSSRESFPSWGLGRKREGKSRARQSWAGRAQVSQSHEPLRNLERTWSQATVDDRRYEVRREAGGFSCRGWSQSPHTEEPRGARAALMSATDNRTPQLSESILAGTPRQ
jgi:hypothetical protein